MTQKESAKNSGHYRQARTCAWMGKSSIMMISSEMGMPLQETITIMFSVRCPKQRNGGGQRGLHAIGSSSLRIILN